MAARMPITGDSLALGNTMETPADERVPISFDDIVSDASDHAAAIEIADELIDVFAGPAVLRLNHTWKSASFDERLRMLIEYTECWLTIFLYEQMPDGVSELVFAGSSSDAVLLWLTQGKRNQTINAAIEPLENGETDDVRFEWLRGFSTLFWPLVEYRWAGIPRVSRIKASKLAAEEQPSQLKSLCESLERLCDEKEKHMRTLAKFHFHPLRSYLKCESLRTKSACRLSMQSKP